MKRLDSLRVWWLVVPCAFPVACSGRIDGPTEAGPTPQPVDIAGPAVDGAGANDETRGAVDVPRAEDEPAAAPADEVTGDEVTGDEVTGEAAGDEETPTGDDPAGQAPAETVVDAPVPCDAVGQVFQQDCSGYACHGGTRFGDFAASQAEAETFVDRSPVVNAFPGCGRMIDPVNPLDSLILRKVLGEYSGNTACGAQMPLGSAIMLSDEKIACIESWLMQFQR